MLILQKYVFKVCVILFGFYSTCYKVYIHLPWININRLTTSPFDITHVISSSNHQTSILYQGSDDHCEGYRNSNIIFLLQQSQTIHYYNQWMLAIVLDLNILVLRITIFISFLEAPWYSYFIWRASYLYNSTGLIFIYLVCYQTRVFVISTVPGEYTLLLLQTYGFKVCAVSFGFWSSYLKVYTHLRCIDTQRQTTTPFSLWLPSSRVSILCWYYKNTFLRFVWYCLVFIQLVIKLISIYPESTHSN